MPDQSYIDTHLAGGSLNRGLRIACLGAGYVGAPTMAMIALKCPDIEVTVLDINQERIDAYNSDDVPIYEPGFAETVKQVRGRNLFFSTDCGKYIERADIIFVSVNTPTKTRGIGAGRAADLSIWERAARSIADYSTSSKIVVEKSTVPVRTAAALQEVLVANETPGVTFTILSNPEFMAEGSAMQDLLNPDRILIGGPDTPAGEIAIQALVDVYATWVERSKILTTGVWSAELGKLVANAFLAQRISSINSITQLCKTTGADVEEVATAIGMDSRIGPKFLKASVGFGGSCFKKDILNLVYILESLGQMKAADYWRQVVLMNEHQKALFVESMVAAMFNTIGNKKIAVFGFAFKNDTGDTRETPAATICAHLLREGAQVAVYDPKVSEAAMRAEMVCQGFGDLLATGSLSFTSSPSVAAENADAIAIVTEWAEFRTLDYEAFYHKMRKPAFVFDGRNIVDREKLFSVGFTVHSIGKPILSPTSKTATVESLKSVPRSPVRDDMQTLTTY